MTAAKVIVTLTGLVVIAWVLWYFLAPLGPSRPSRGSGLR
jgi:plastocyanin domain-containing protein